MANITILDTGYIKPDHSGTQLSSGNRANAGTSMTLKTATFLPEVASIQDDTSVIGVITLPEINHASTIAPKFTITGLLNTSNSDDTDLLYQLWRLPLTYGYKALYYNVDKATSVGSSEKRDQQLITLLANSHYDTTESQSGISISLWTGSSYTSSKDLTDVYHIHVQFESFKPRATGGEGIISYTLTGKILPNTE